MIVERHYDEETLIGLLLADRQSGDTARDPHLAACASCSETLESYRAVAHVLGEDAVWDLRQLTSGPDEKTLARLRSFSTSLSTEVGDAASLVDQLMAHPRASWSAIAKGDLRYQSAAVVRQLVDVSETVLDTLPPDALELARAAVETAQLVGDDESASDVVRKARGAAWRQYGYALFYIGEFPKALDAAERARVIFEQCAVADYDLARVGIVRALALGSQERVDEAITVAEESARVFRAWGDRRRVASALNTQAYILIQKSRFQEALPILLEIEDAYKMVVDTDARARVIGNIALCYWQTGKVVEALQNYQVAAAIHEEAGTKTEAARIRYNVADLLAAQGRFTEAKERLRRVRDEFQQMGMDHAAVSAGLSLAEIFLAEGRVAEVETLCRTAIEQFARTGLGQTSDGLMALTYLREATAARRATPEVVRHVRKYLERLPQEPRLLFVAPPPAPG
jgi:tetratricopeptide (TPR) repeat protein